MPVVPTQEIVNRAFEGRYGVAAINVGRVPEGILALERHLTAVPANDRARLELARGYYLIADYGRARSEFEFVLRYNPPAEVKTQIAAFLQAMTLRDPNNLRGAARLYAEFGVGHDSNVNLGTQHDEVLFGFGPVSLAGTTSQAAPDDFIHVAVGGQQTMRVSNRLSLFAGLDIDAKRNFDVHDFDLSNAAVNVGFSLVSGPGQYRSTLVLATQQLGSNPYRDSLALQVEGNYTLPDETYLTWFGQYNEFRFDPEPDRDARATTLGGAVSKNLLAAPWQPSLGLRLSWTQEDNLTGRTDFSRRLSVARVFASVTPADRWRLSAAFTAIHSHYRAPDVIFGSVRSESTYTLDLAAAYALAPRWTLRAEYMASLNRSNQDLYDYRRQMLTLKTRYQY